MKNIAAVALFVAAGFVTAGSALAQDHKVTATIPFSFSVDGRSLPAGDYTLGSDMNHPYTLLISDRAKNVHALAIALPDTSERQKNNKLIFHRYGDQYFLSEIRADGASMNCHLVPSKQEKWARQETQEASVRGNNNVLVALK